MIHGFYISAYLDAALFLPVVQGGTRKKYFPLSTGAYQRLANA